MSLVYGVGELAAEIVMFKMDRSHGAREMEMGTLYMALMLDFWLR
jgi:hypothetical protein